MTILIHPWRMSAALFVRGEDELRARSAWGAAGVVDQSLSCLPDQPVRTAGSSGLEFRGGQLQVVACVWTDHLVPVEYLGLFDHEH